MADSVKVKSRREEVTAAEAGEILSHMAMGFVSGGIEVADGEDGALHVMQPSSLVKVEVRGEEGKGGAKVTVQISWKPELRIGAPSP